MQRPFLQFDATEIQNQNTCILTTICPDELLAPQQTIMLQLLTIMLQLLSFHIISYALQYTYIKSDIKYKKAIKSKVADINNIGEAGRYGGACTAAAFL